jgi:ubiquinone/menaquinone biosynthesis C-methylase UbiE
MPRSSFPTCVQGCLCLIVDAVLALSPSILQRLLLLVKWLALTSNRFKSSERSGCQSTWRYYARFVVADVYALPFADATFDAVFTHAMLYHIRDPLRVLREFRRVLKPEGLVGIRDTDYSMWCMEPDTPALDEARRLSLLVAEHDGASPTHARHQRHLLLKAGFAYAEATASCVSKGTLEQTRGSARAMLSRLRSPSFQQTALQQAWVTSEQLDSLCAEVQAWGERPDAFECLVWRAAIGWVSDRRSS